MDRQQSVASVLKVYRAARGRSMTGSVVELSECCVQEWNTAMESAVQRQPIPASLS